MQVEESGSDYTSDESYDSDDDEAHVVKHKKSKGKKKKRRKSKSTGLFKPNEIEEWEEEDLESTREEMAKQLAMLMYQSAAVNAQQPPEVTQVLHY